MVREHRDRRARRQPPGVAHLLGEREVALADEVAVADGGVGAAVDRGVAVDREGDQRTGAVDDLHLADRPDPDAGNADVVALVDARGVGEHRLVLPRRPEVEVADGHHQHRCRERGDDDEDEQLDQVDRGPGIEDPAHRSDTSAPRAIGPTRRTPRSGTSSVLTPRPGASSDLSSADSLAAAREPGSGAGPAGTDAAGALAGGLVDAVDEVGLGGHRVALGPRRGGQRATVVAALVAVDRDVLRAVAARLVGQRLQDDVEGEAAERLGLELARPDDAAEQAGVARGVAREQLELCRAEVREPDQVVTVGAGEAVGNGGQLRHVVEERLQPVLAVLERRRRGDGVAEDRGDLRQHVGVRVGDPRREPQVLDEGGQLGVEAGQVVVERLERLAELLAPPLEGGRDRVEGGVEVGGLHRTQQGVEVAEHLLDLDGEVGALDDVAVGDRLRRRPAVGDDQGDELLAEEGLGQDRGGDVARHVGGAVPVEAERDVGARSGGLVVEHLAHDHSLDLDVGARWQLEPDPGRLDRDLVVVGELVGEHAVRRPHRTEHEDQEHDSQGLRLHRRRHPASRTVVDAPQIAMDISRSSTLMATMLVRTARPTATPTPAGPPEAL